MVETPRVTTAQASLYERIRAALTEHAHTAAAGITLRIDPADIWNFVSQPLTRDVNPIHGLGHTPQIVPGLLVQAAVPKLLAEVYSFNSELSDVGVIINSVRTDYLGVVIAGMEVTVTFEVVYIDPKKSNVMVGFKYEVTIVGEGSPVITGCIDLKFIRGDTFTKLMKVLAQRAATSR